MPTKEKILQMFLEGKNQEEILETLHGPSEKKKKAELRKLHNQIRENAFLSPKNIKYGSILVFFVTYLSPVFAIYMKGYEYEVLLRPIFILSLILSIPFLIFAIYFYLTKNLKTISIGGLAFLIYYVVYLITFMAIAADIHVWTIILFPLVIMPTMITEWFKLRLLIREIEIMQDKKD